jgi:hypothetical protein
MIWLERRRVRQEPNSRLSRWLRRFGYRARPSDVDIIVWRYARERAAAAASPGEDATAVPVIDPDNLSRIEQWLEDGIPLAEIRRRISSRYPNVTDSQLTRVLHR